MTGDFINTLSEDTALTMSELVKFTPADRQKIDTQIRGCQRAVLSMGPRWRNGVKESTWAPLEILASAANVKTGTAGRTQVTIRDPGTINVCDPPYNAVGDGVADDTAAMVAVAASVNASTHPPTIIFPPGIYKYTGGLEFDKQVRLVGHGRAILNYTGTGKAVRMGPVATIGTWRLHRIYAIENLEFTGGASMSHGIYFNEWITEPRMHKCRFVDFGNASAFAVFCQYQNWACLFTNCINETSDTGAVGRHWIKIAGTSLVTVPATDYGQSRLRMSHCESGDRDTVGGVGVEVSGVGSEIIHCNFSGHVPAVRIVGNSASCRVFGCYFEQLKPGYAIEYGDVGAGVSTVDKLVASQNFCNVHNLDDVGNVNGRFMGPSGVNAFLTNAVVRDNDIASAAGGTELVTLSNSAYHTGCKASGNTGTDLQHTVGTVVTAWDCEQDNGALQSFELVFHNDAATLKHAIVTDMANVAAPRFCNVTGHSATFTATPSVAGGGAPVDFATGVGLQAADKTCIVLNTPAQLLADLAMQCEVTINPTGATLAAEAMISDINVAGTTRKRLSIRMRNGNAWYDMTTIPVGEYVAIRVHGNLRVQ